MSMNRKQTTERIDLAFESLEGIRQAVPAPFLYTRVRARMENRVRPVWERVSEVLSRPWVATSLAAILIVVNAYILFNALGVQSGEVHEEHLIASNSEYASHTSSFYEPNPEWP